MFTIHKYTVRYKSLGIGISLYVLQLVVLQKNAEASRVVVVDGLAAPRWAWRPGA